MALNTIAYKGEIADDFLGLNLTLKGDSIEVVFFET